MESKVLVLSPAQEDFAEQHDATPGFDAGNGTGVFFYRHEERMTDRWLVDRQGAVLEEVHFRLRAA